MFAACGTHESLVSDGGLQVMPLMPSPWGFWISVSSGDGYETVHQQCWGDWKIEFFWNNKNLQCNVGLGLELPSVFKLWLHNIAHNSGLAMIKTFDLPWWRTCKVRNFLFSVVFFSSSKPDSWKPETSCVDVHVSSHFLRSWFFISSWAKPRCGQQQQQPPDLPIGKAAARPGWS